MSHLVKYLILIMMLTNYTEHINTSELSRESVSSKRRRLFLVVNTIIIVMMGYFSVHVQLSLAVGFHTEGYSAPQVHAKTRSAIHVHTSRRHPIQLCIILQI